MKGTFKILYLIQLPPPLHGVSKLNEFIFQSKKINNGYEKQAVVLKFSNDLSELSALSIKKLFFFFKVIKNLIFELFFFKPDMVYFTIVPTGKAFYRDLVFVFLLKLFRKKIIYHFHGQGIQPFILKRYNKRLYNWALKNAFVIHLSKGLLESEFQGLKIEKEKSFYVNNGVENLNFSPIYEKNKVIKILFFSNKFRSKGVFILVEVLSKLKSEGFDFELIFIGGSAGLEVDQELESQIEKENLANNVRLLGGIYTDEKYDYFKEADIFIHPTLNDALPLVLLDAMQFGLPVVSSNIGAIPEIIENNKNGFLTDPGDVDDIVDCLKRFFLNKELIKQMGLESRKKYLESYTMECFENEIKTVFEKVIQ